MVTINYYEILDVDNFAKIEMIKKAFRLLAKKHHPDMETGNRSKFECVREAYEKLLDPSFKNHHDAMLKMKSKKKTSKSKKSSRNNKKQYSQDFLDEMTFSDKIDVILNWAKENDSFNPFFVLCMQKKLDKYDNLTDSQNQALDNILIRFYIDIEKYLED